MPPYMLRQMITYKALAAGIDVIVQEESYTSKADSTAGDHIPVYCVDDENASFSGYRVGRGLYRCHDGRIINADLNGAANILRKALPDAFDGVADYAFLSESEVSGFHELNPPTYSGRTDRGCVNQPRRYGQPFFWSERSNCHDRQTKIPLS